ncbi:MAG: hypothetical protein ACTSRZ_08315 [Promethearchaeota archaeon]
MTNPILHLIRIKQIDLINMKWVLDFRIEYGKKSKKSKNGVILKSIPLKIRELEFICTPKLYLNRDNIFNSENLNEFYPQILSITFIFPYIRVILKINSRNNNYIDNFKAIFLEIQLRINGNNINGLIILINFKEINNLESNHHSYKLRIINSFMLQNNVFLELELPFPIKYYRNIDFYTYQKVIGNRGYNNTTNNSNEILIFNTRANYNYDYNDQNNSKIKLNMPINSLESNQRKKVFNIPLSSLIRNYIKNYKIEIINNNDESELFIECAQIFNRKIYKINFRNSITRNNMINCLNNGIQYLYLLKISLIPFLLSTQKFLVTIIRENNSRYISIFPEPVNRINLELNDFLTNVNIIYRRGSLIKTSIINNEKELTIISVKLPFNKIIFDKLNSNNYARHINDNYFTLSLFNIFYYFENTIFEKQIKEDIYQKPILSFPPLCYSYFNYSQNNNPIFERINDIYYNLPATKSNILRQGIFPLNLGLISNKDNLFEGLKNAISKADIFIWGSHGDLRGNDFRIELLINNRRYILNSTEFIESLSNLDFLKNLWLFIGFTCHSFASINFINNILSLGISNYIGSINKLNLNIGEIVIEFINQFFMNINSEKHLIGIIFPLYLTIVKLEELLKRFQLAIYKCLHQNKSKFVNDLPKKEFSAVFEKINCIKTNIAKNELIDCIASNIKSYIQRIINNNFPENEYNPKFVNDFSADIESYTIKYLSQYRLNSIIKLLKENSKEKIVNKIIEEFIKAHDKSIEETEGYYLSNLILLIAKNLKL